MTLPRTDVRFTLSRPVDRALVLGELDGWQEGLQTAGTLMVDNDPTLVVAPSSLVERAVSTGAPVAVIEGRGTARRLRRAYGHVNRLLPTPDLDAPEFLIPRRSDGGALCPGKHACRRDAMEGRAQPGGRRSDLARSVPGRASSAHSRPEDLGPPFIVAAAVPFGIPLDVGWLLTLGRGDALTRAVFHLFPAGSPNPAWVLKFARVPGYRKPFDRDEQGLRLVRQAVGVVAGHAPTLLGRFEAEGLSIAETAAVGETSPGSS